MRVAVRHAIKLPALHSSTASEDKHVTLNIPGRFSKRLGYVLYPIDEWQAYGPEHSAVRETALYSTLGDYVCTTPADERCEPPHHRVLVFLDSRIYCCQRSKK
jgi:hypothetical protein